jgi:hypothetical protein
MTKNIEQQLEVEIKRFLENIENQNHSDRISTLRNMFDKYLHLSTCDHMMDRHDLTSIINSAKSSFASKTMPIHLGEKCQKVRQSDLSNLCIIEATISHLNQNNCLKKLAKFDVREDKYVE